MLIKKIAKNIIPQHYHWALYNKVRDITGWRSKSYSSFAEDLVVAKIMDNKKKGFYVDVGAFHPFKYSNTYYLKKYFGWKGINIEPNPESFSLFEKHRPGDINLNLGVSEQSGHLNYYMFPDGLYNTFDKKRMEDLAESGMKPLGGYEILVIPLSRILTENAQGQNIDFLNIDVEMLDLEVLKSNDWDHFRPTVIAIEDHDFKMESFERSPIFKFLSKQGYRLESKCHFTVIYKLI